MLVRLGLGPQPRKTSQGSTGATHQNPSDYIMFLGEPLDKAVHFGPAPKARAKKIRQLEQGNRDLDTILSDIRSCIERANNWNKLSPTERITLELIWTNLMLELLRIGNTKLMHSLRNRLCKQTVEENELEQGRDR